MGPDRTIAGICRDQHGVASRGQLAQAGIGRDHIRARVQRGQLEFITPRVVKLAGSAATDAQKMMISVLHVGPGAVISHQTAARWWGLPGFRLEPIAVTLLRSRRVLDEPNHVIHHATVLPRDHVLLVEGIPIASPALTLFQLAADMSEGRLAAVVDRAWSMRLTSGAELNDLLGRLGRSGRNGISVMRTVLSERGNDYRPPQSGLEMRAREILRSAGFEPRAQVDLGDDQWTGRVDFLLEEWGIVIEIQSERFHSSLTDKANDHRRLERLRDDGFTVVEVWDTDVFHRPYEVVERVRAAVYRKIVASQPRFSELSEG